MFQVLHATNVPCEDKNYLFKPIYVQFVVRYTLVAFYLQQCKVFNKSMNYYCHTATVSLMFIDNINANILPGATHTSSFALNLTAFYINMQIDDDC